MRNMQKYKEFIQMNENAHEFDDEFEYDENEEEENHSNGQFWGKQGAGVLIIAEDTKKILVAFRSAYVLEPHTYNVIGGAIDSGLSPEIAVRKELKQESGYGGAIKLIPAYVFRAPNNTFTYFNYIGLIKNEFEPIINWETSHFEWLTFDELLQLKYKHFGLEGLIKNSKSLIEQYSK